MVEPRTSNADGHDDEEAGGMRHDRLVRVEDESQSVVLTAAGRSLLESSGDETD